MRDFLSCEICFLSKAGARAGIAELAKLGIETKILDDIRDPCSDETTFVLAWRVIDFNETVYKLAEKTVMGFDETVRNIADQNDGRSDCLDLYDHEPVAADFGLYPSEVA
jgi:hypothetical protein